MSARTALPAASGDADRARARSTPSRAAQRPGRGVPSPRPRRNAVPRPRLVRALVGEQRPLVVVVAPAGYGKTTLLVQWRAADPRPFAWLALHPPDDDPPRLVRSAIAALAAIDPSVGRASTLAELLDGLDGLEPSALVIDRVDELRSAAARDVIATLAERVPAGTTLVLASRTEPPLPLARLRAEDAVAELRADRLAMTRAEAAEMLRRAGVPLAAGQMADLLELADGWPAALQLAAGALRDERDPGTALAAFGGDDRVIASYVRDELLSALDVDDRAFLRRSSVLDEWSGEVCDAALGRDDSALVLRRLAGFGIPLTALDRAQRAFRPHPLVAQALRAELRCAERGLEAALHRRASDMFERAGDVDRAVDHAVAGAATARVAQLLGPRAAAAIASGRRARIDRWLGALPPDAVAAQPPLATAKALSLLVAGERDAAERCVDAVPRAGADDATVAGALVVEAAIARRGPAQMARAAARAAALAPSDALRSFACLLLGTSRCLSGDTDGAGARLDEGARLAILDAPLVRALCLAEMALLLADRDRHEAGELADAARTIVQRRGLDGEPLAALPYAVSAVALAHGGRLDTARGHVGEAVSRLDRLPGVVPWYGAMTRLALARCALRLSDVRAARRMLDGASRLAARTAGAVGLRRWLDDAWRRVDDYSAGPAACPMALTIAELRVVRFLPSHLSLREIAGRLDVSANTVKTQVHAAYRKLDATSRSEAVARARALGLVEG